MIEFLLERGPHLLVVALLVLGVYKIIASQNFLDALVGLYLFQSGIIVFFISLAALRGGTVPVLPPEGPAPLMVNPLPHALMLTAIVVGVATFGVGVAILRRLLNETQHIEEKADNTLS